MKVQPLSRSFAASLLFSLLFIAPAHAQEIRVLLSSTAQTQAEGNRLTAAIALDCSGSNARLGSYTATVRWDTARLHFHSFRGGTTPGFASPVVNQQQVEHGTLTLAHAYPQGAELGAIVNIFNLTLEPLRPEASLDNVEIEFSALAAAHTFEDLLPQLITTITNIGDPGIEATPATFHMAQNYPNPFNPQTEIRFHLPGAAAVRLAVYDVLGRQVRLLLQGDRAAGSYSITWDGKDDNGIDVPSGIYLYRFATGGFVQQKKMVLLR